jgi:hypothetical protein
MSKTVHLQTLPALLRSKFSLVRTGLVGYSYIMDAPEVITKAEKKPKSAFFGRVASLFSYVSDKIAVIAIAISLIVGIALLAPQAYYAFTPIETVPVETTEQGTALGGSFDEGTVAVEEEVNTYIPPKNEALPEGEWLVIPRIGVRTELLHTEDSEEALAKGVWMVPGYGEAGSTDLPLILAAHRFGWEWWWQSDYWKYNSFYLLPDTEPGDVVEIISDQRKWVYEIYGGAEGDAIADYDADLILYTCKFLNSPVRHFRYARLIDPTANTQ